MKRLVHPVFLLPAVACAGTSDPGGIASAILWLILVAFGIWVIISIFIGRALGQAASTRLILAMVLSSLPLAYCEFTSYQFNSGLKELADQNKALVEMANGYLVERCALDRVQRAQLRVEPSGGVFITVDYGRLDIPDTPQPPPETSQMRSDQKRYGESNPVTLNEIQYKAPVNWVRDVYPEPVLLASSFTFAEASDRHSRDYVVRATAHKNWWLGPGQQAIDPSSRQELDRRISDLPDDKRHWLSLPVKSSSARYVFSVADISTLEDRRHWVARARLRLVHKDSGEVAAEYVGFAANLAPAYVPKTSYPWDRVAVCPGKERDYQGERAPWRAAEFFFREVVSYKPSLSQ